MQVPDFNGKTDNLTFIAEDQTKEEIEALYLDSMTKGINLILEVIDTECRPKVPLGLAFLLIPRDNSAPATNVVIGGPNQVIEMYGFIRRHIRAFAPTIGIDITMLDSVLDSEITSGKHDGDQFPIAKDENPDS